MMRRPKPAVDMSTAKAEEKYFIVEQADDGTLFVLEWFEGIKKARKRAKEDSKGLRTEGHSILLCEVLATHEKES